MRTLTPLIHMNTSTFCRRSASRRRARSWQVKVRGVGVPGCEGLQGKRPHFQAGQGGARTLRDVMWLNLSFLLAAASLSDREMDGERQGRPPVVDESLSVPLPEVERRRRGW